MQKKVSLAAIIICLFSGSFYLYDFILQVSPGVITNELMHDLQLDAAGLGIVSGFYFFAYMPMQLFAGLLNDRFGPRKLLTIMVFLCAAGALLFSAAHDFWSLAFGRMLMGFGSAFAFTGTLVLISRWFPTHYFAPLSGVLQLMSSVGALVASAPLALFIAKHGWRASIFDLAIVGFVLAAIIGMVVRDYPANSTLKSTYQIGEVARLKEVCHRPQTWLIGVYSFLMWAPMIVFGELWGVPYISELYHVSIAKASTVTEMVWIGIAISCPLVGLLSERIQQRLSLLRYMALLGLIASIGILFGTQLSFVVMCVFGFLLGFSASGAILTFAMVNDINAPSNLGTALGFNNMMVVAGGALLHPLVGYILHTVWSGTVVNNTPVYSAQEYRLGLIVIPIIYVIALLMSWKSLKESYWDARKIS